MVESPPVTGEDGEDAVLSSQMEDFHPHEYYVLCEWGPTVIGGCGHVNFLKNEEDIQESLGNTGSREKFRSKTRSDEDAVVFKVKKIPWFPALYILWYSFVRTSLAVSRGHSIRRLKVVCLL